MKLLNYLKILLLFSIITIIGTTSYCTDATPDDINMINLEPGDLQVSEETNNPNEQVNPEGDTDSDEVEYTKSIHINTPNEDYTLDEIVDGNVFINAKNVTIKNIIGGSLFINAQNVVFSGSNPFIQGNVYINAQTVSLSKDTMIYANLFVNATNASISGQIYDLYANGTNITINEGAMIYRDAKISVKNAFTFLGSVNRDLQVYGGKTYIFENESEENEEDLQNSITSPNNKYGYVGGLFEYTTIKDMNIPTKIVENPDDIIHHSLKRVLAKFFINIFISLTVIYIILISLIMAFSSNSLEIIYTNKSLIDILKFGLLFAIISICTLVISLYTKLFIITLVVASLCVCITLTGMVLISYTLINNLSEFKNASKLLKYVISFILFVLLVILLIFPVINLATIIISLIFGSGILFSSDALKKLKVLDKKTTGKVAENSNKDKKNNTRNNKNKKSE